MPVIEKMGEDNRAGKVEKKGSGITGEGSSIFGKDVSDLIAINGAVTGNPLEVDSHPLLSEGEEGREDREEGEIKEDRRGAGENGKGGARVSKEAKRSERADLVMGSCPVQCLLDSFELSHETGTVLTSRKRERGRGGAPGALNGGTVAIAAQRASY